MARVRVDAGTLAPCGVPRGRWAGQGVRPAAQHLVGPHAAFQLKAQQYPSWQCPLNKHAQSTPNHLQGLPDQSGSGLFVPADGAPDGAEARQHHSVRRCELAAIAFLTAAGAAAAVLVATGGSAPVPGDGRAGWGPRARGRRTAGPC